MRLCRPPPQPLGHDIANRPGGPVVVQIYAETERVELPRQVTLANCFQGSGRRHLSAGVSIGRLKRPASPTGLEPATSRSGTGPSIHLRYGEKVHLMRSSVTVWMTKLGAAPRSRTGHLPLTEGLFNQMNFSGGVADGN